MEQKTTSYKPNSKVTAGAIAGAVTTILVWLAGTYGGVEVPPEVASAVTVLVTLLVSYFKREAVVAVLLILMLPIGSANAQVTNVTSERIAFNLPHGETYDYSRDIIALKDSMWAQENVSLAFMLSGGVEVPPFQDSLRTVVDSLYDAVLTLEAENGQLAATISEQSGEIAQLEADLLQAQSALEPVQATLDSLRMEEAYAIRRMREIMEIIR